MLSNTLSVSKRIIIQVLRDKRFLFYFCVFPIIFFYLLKIALLGIQKTLGEFFYPEILSVGFAAFLLHIMTFTNCLLIIIKENYRQTTERMFISSYRRLEILMGYIVGYSIIIIIQMPPILLSIIYFWGLPIQKSIFATLLSLFFLGLTSIGLALLFSNLAVNEEQVLTFIPFIILPSVVFTDFIFPTEQVPASFKIISYFVPMKYALDVMKPSLLEGKIIANWWIPVGILFLYTIVTLILGSFIFKERK